MSFDSTSSVKQYLLGTLSPEEKSRFEERYFTDDDLFEEIEIVEDDLIDSYIGRRLSNGDLELFEKNLINSPRLVKRVEFARILAKSIAKPVEAPRAKPALQPQIVSKPGSARPSWLTFPFTSRLSLGWASSTLLLLLAGGVLLFGWIRSREESRLLAQQRAELEQRNRALSVEIDKQRSELTAELNLERSEKDRLLQELEVIQKQSAGSQPKNTTFAFLLSPGGMRDPRGGNRRTVSPQFTQIRLTLTMPSDDYSAYTATVKTVEERQVWSKKNLKARAGRDGKVIELLIQRSQLPDALYLVDVYGVSASGQAERVANYSFQIVTSAN